MGGGEERGSWGEAGKRPVVYCLIPFELAPKLHDLLRGHFAEEAGVEVVVEHRHRERRRGAERRRDEQAPPGGEDRRKVRSAAGRRAGERRAALAEVAEPPQLPRRARRYASQLSFVERLEPSSEQSEDLDTARLVMRFQAGDREVFDTLYTRYFDRVYGYLRVALRDRHEAEDAAQQVFAKVLEALPDYERRRQPFRAWLFAAVRHQAIDELRRLSRLEPTDPAELGAMAEAASETEREPAFDVLDWLGDPDLLMLVERLPAAQRQVLVLRFMFDLSDRQIAAHLGRTASDVRALQHRALRFIRERLKALGREPKPGSRRFDRRRTRPAPVLRERRFVLR